MTLWRPSIGPSGAWVSLHSHVCPVFMNKCSFSNMPSHTDVDECCMPVSWNLATLAFDQSSMLVLLAACLCPAVLADGFPGELAHTVAGVKFTWNVAFEPSAERGLSRPCSPCLRLYCSGLSVIMCLNWWRGHIELGSAVVNNICSVSFLLLHPLLSWSPAPSATATPSLLAYSNLH